MEAEEQEEVDILNPLATFHWEKCCNLPEHVSDVQCVSVHGKIYVGGGTKKKLFVSTTDLKSWIPYDTPTYWYALTTYHSQLVLIGGCYYNSVAATNGVWVAGENIKWQVSLPPMKIRRSSSSAINTGRTQCIVVAGGYGTGRRLLKSVEVLTRGKWSSVKSLPKPCTDAKCAVHNGFLYLMGGHELGTSVFYCKLDSLLSSSRSGSLWKEFQAPLEYSSCVTFCHHLLSVGGSSSSSIHVYTPLTRSWVHVEDLPVTLESIASTVISTGELIVIGGPWSYKVYKASVIVSPFNPDSEFNLSAFSRLEYAGVQIMTSLEKTLTPLKNHLGLYNRYDLGNLIKEWKSERASCPPTWKSLLSVLKELDLKKLSQQIEDYFSGKQIDQYLAAYHQILTTHGSLDMLFLSMLFVGPSRLGKTTSRRRLTGDIIDIDSARESEQTSTGVVATVHNVVVPNISSNATTPSATNSSGDPKQSITGEHTAIRSISHTTAMVTPSEWSATKDLTHEARILLEFFSQEKPSRSQVKRDGANSSKSDVHVDLFQSGTETYTRFNSRSGSNASDFRPSFKKNKRNIADVLRTAFRIKRKVNVSADSETNLVMTDDEIFDFFQEAVTTPSNWEEVKFLLENTALLNMSDTGGQPEFMDMLPALVIGSALYLIFCKLTQSLQSSYTVSYLSPSGESTTPVESTYTVEEVMFQVLSAIACLADSNSEKEQELTASAEENADNSSFREVFQPSTTSGDPKACPQSKAFIIATHKDLVSEDNIEKFDAELQRRIRATDFYRDGLVQFASESRLILAVDNKSGGAGEVDTLRKFFEQHMQHYKKISIPAAWLVLSLYLRKQEKRTVSLCDCLNLGQKLNMFPEETRLALWFLHHRAGTLMYFPDLPELQDTVISDVQIIYDSVSNLIVNTFRFGRVGEAASERFRETGQFSLDDIKEATADISGNYIPLFKLVKLLEYLNIIAVINQPDQDSSAKSSKVIYFMPCVLQNIPNEELHIHPVNDSHSLLPASLMIRYKCGFVPLGLFPATIANLVGKDSLTLIIEGIKKNRVQFRYGADRTIITLISRSQYYEIHITLEPFAQTETRIVCGAVREIVESSLKTVTSRMNYAFTVSYQLAFECPSHPGRDHLCVVNSRETSPHIMDCLHNLKNPQPIKMQSQHLVWFDEPLRSVVSPDLSATPPTMMDIICFPLQDSRRVDLTKEVGAKYLQFGILLLEDQTGAHISALERELVKNAQDINYRVFQEWLHGKGRKPVSWETLVSVLEDIGLNQLAKSIRDVKL